jgi:hypothetical protein
MQNQATGKIIHPFLLGVYPVLMLLARNLEAVNASFALRPLLLSLLGTVFLLLATRWLLGSWQKSAPVTSSALVFFFSYGHVYTYIEQINVAALQIGRHRFLAPIWLALFLASVWWVRAAKGKLAGLNRSLNLFAGLIFIFPLAQMGLFAYRSLESGAGTTTAKAQLASLKAPASQPPPDIYYIILDGYARDDVLNKFYELDNTGFLKRLQEMGFYVVPCAQSNYAQTQLSLASSLNLNYLEPLDDRYLSSTTSRVGLPHLIKHSAVRQSLQDSGYTTVAFETGYEATELRDADVFLSPRTIQALNDFESLLIRTTAGRLLAEGVAALNIRPDWEARDEAHRVRVLYALEELPAISNLQGPKFVFAHIVSPHWPHVFGPDGEPVHEHQDSASGYRDQVIFINQKIEPILAEIIANSPLPPIIIVQGDHGSIIESPARRMSILNAYYLPDGGDQQLYENISPVNSFRLIFDYYLGADYELLPDISYYSQYDRPYAYTQVHEERPGCP